MSRFEEIEGTPRETASLSRTVETVLSLVRRSRGEPEPSPDVTREDIEDLMAEFNEELEAVEQSVAVGVEDRQERVDLRRMRAALYSGGRD